MGLSNLDKVGDIMPHRAASGGGGGGSVNSVTAGDTTITVAGTATDPTVIVGTLVPGSNGVPTLAAADTTMTVGGTATARTVAVGTLVPGSNGVPTLAAADATMTVGGTATARTVAVGTITPGSNGTIALGSATPTTVSLSAPAAGSGATAAKIDHSHDLSLAIAPAWTGQHTWSNAAVPIQATITDGSAATQLEAARFRHLSSVAGSGGNAVYTGWWATNNAPAAIETARLTAVQSVVTAGSERGVIVFSAMSAGTMTPQSWMVLGQVFAASSFSIGALTLATGVTTILNAIQISSSMVNYNSGSAAQGGHSFTGTVNTSGARSFMIFTPSSNTGATAGTSLKIYDHQTHTHQWASNTTVATFSEMSVAAPTLAFASATGTVTDCATVYIDQAPILGTNAAFTRSYSLWVDAGLVRLDSTTANGTTATALTNVGPAGANTTVQEWLTININGTNRFIPCW